MTTHPTPSAEALAFMDDIRKHFNKTRFCAPSDDPLLPIIDRHFADLRIRRELASDQTLRAAKETIQSDIDFFARHLARLGVDRAVIEETVSPARQLVRQLDQLTGGAKGKG